MTTPIKIARAALLMLTALAACASTASAAGDKYDPSYGTAALPTIPGETRLTATTCEAMNSDILALTGVAGGFTPGAGPQSKTIQRTTIATVHANGKRRTGWRTVPSGRGETIVASDFSRYGAFAYVHAPITERRKARTFIVRKVRTSAGKDPDWHDVTITLPAPTGDTFGTSVNVLNLRDGGILVVIDRPDAQRIYRFTRTGESAKFGVNGVVTNVPTGPAAWYVAPDASTPLLETWDHKLLIAASGRPGQPAAGKAIGLLKLDAEGAVVDRFADHGLWTPPSALAEEAPLTDTQREAPQTLDVIGGGSARKRLTVLFGTKNGNEFGTDTLTAAAQLSQNGTQVSVSKSFDEGTDGGDGGFPDAQPFTFVPTVKGFTYASAWSQYGGGNTVDGFGVIAQLNRLLAPPVATHQILVHGPFIAFDFAATPDGKYVYSCGAVSRKSAKAKWPWSKYSPALRRFKL